MKVWTLGYEPFVMGGSVWQPISTDVEPDSGPFDLGKGLEGYLIVSPDGNKSFIAEGETGAFVGTSLNAVRDDVAAANEAVIEWQMKEARKDAARAKHLTPEEFWSKRFQ